MATLVQWLSDRHEAQQDGRLTVYVGLMRGFMDEKTLFLGGSAALEARNIAGELDAYVMSDGDLDILLESEVERIMRLKYKPYIVPSSHGTQVYFIRNLSVFLQRMTDKISDTHLELEVVRVHFH